MRYWKLLLGIVITLALLSCGKNEPLGSKSNPIKMYFVPSMEAGTIITNGKAVADYLTERTGYYFKVAVPTSYASVIEAMGTDETDIAWFATFAYVLAHEKYDAEVALTVVRKGLAKYKGQFVARTDGDVNCIEDIQGKVIAYTDAASTSGYMYPHALLKQRASSRHNPSFLADIPKPSLPYIRDELMWAAPFGHQITKTARFGMPGGQYYRPIQTSWKR